MRLCKWTLNTVMGSFLFILDIQVVTSVSYHMVFASVREDNPRTLAKGLSSVQMHKPYNNFLIALTFLLHQHASALCAMRII